MSARLETLLLALGLTSLACMRPPPPFWETDPSLAGPYPPEAGHAVHHGAGRPPVPMGHHGASAHHPAHGHPSPSADPHGSTPQVPPATTGGGQPHGGHTHGHPTHAHPTPAGSGQAVKPVPKPQPPMPRQPFHAPIPRIGKSAPAMTYANLQPGACRKELRRRKLPFKVERKGVRGIANPVRVAGEMNGVRVISAPAPSPFGLLDCRLALALDDLTKLLSSYDIAQIYIGSMYRKGARIAHRGTKSQHSYGLAMDILSMRHEDGRLMVVKRDWHAGIGEASCGPKAVMHEPNPSSILMRNVVCDLARRHIFHHMLTPGSNRAHHDHFHFDIKRGVKYQSVR